MSATSALRRVLMVAFIFPPFYSPGGSIRAVKFTKYLPALGWLPAVLTIDDTVEHENQRRQGSESLLADVPDEVKVYRTVSGEPSAAFLEKGRQARSRGRLLGAIINLLSRFRQFASHALLMPDENVTWLPFAVRYGRRIVKTESIDVLFATCPPHSVALTATVLKWFTGKPLVLDFRDDWVDTPWHLSKPWLRRQTERGLERIAINAATRVILVTERSRQAFVARYPREPRQKFVCIPNGVDLADMVSRPTTQAAAPTSTFTIVHAGLLSVAEDWKRSPETFFTALERVMQRDSLLAKDLRVVFTGHLPPLYKDMLKEKGLSDVVQDVGFLPRDEFNDCMQNADLLLAINYEGWTTIVPGKVYEYWALGGPPILLLSSPGAAQDLVTEHELGISVAPTDVQGIEDALLLVYRRREEGRPMRTSTVGIERYERQQVATELAQLLDATLAE